MSTPENTDWIKSVVGSTFFRFVDGVKEIRFPAVGSVPELIIRDNGQAGTRIDGPRPSCAICGDEATHTIGSRSLCPDHAAA